MFDVVIIYLSIATSFLNCTVKKIWVLIPNNPSLSCRDGGADHMGANVSFLSASTGENHS